MVTHDRRDSGADLSARNMRLPQPQSETPVVQVAAAYQCILDIAAQTDVHEGIRQGLRDVAYSRTKPAHAVFVALRRKHAIAR